ncbi:MAG TPA: hypothetical protein VFG00_15385 [Acidothermaceae bacterium]|nr:hypothetical protein [Acidothermaceae bacterium]
MAAGGAALEAGARTPAPLAGARDDAGGWSGAGGTLAEGCDDGVEVFGATCGCDDVQPASTSDRAATVSATLRGIRRWAWTAIADITYSLWPPHMTNP